MKRDEALRRFFRGVELADPKTLWTLGRSVLDCPSPGDDFLSLSCPCVYYWDSETTTAATQSFLARHNVRQRSTNGAGHWPMINAPVQFYGAVEQDVLRATEPAAIG